VMINDATVTLPDVAASNGVVHIIDKVLIPPSTLITNTVVDLAVATADLSTLVTALQAADLVSTLSVPGPFTVFAPTNDAFNALPAGLLDSLLRPEGKAQLVQLLTYHVASGNVKAQDISDGQQIATLDGGNYVTAAVSGGAVMLNDASVTVPDQVASNGVVHIINKVLIPPGIGLALKTIPEVVTDTSTLSTLLSALRTADLVTTLSGAGPFTVFAPTDTAFYGLPSGLLDMLLEPANKAKLVQLLQYHVVSGDVGSKAISDGQQITTLEGSTVSATVSGASVKINDASVTSPDIDASNGVVHIIDKVLLPPGAFGLPMKTIPQVASETASLSTLVTAIQAADLLNTLNEPGPLTVFAPTNDAFNALPAGLLESLLKPENKVQLAELLTYHVGPGRFAAADITDGLQIMTLDGKDNFAKLNATVSGGSVMINDANVLTPDNMASNGVVHIIDKVLIPPGFVAPSTSEPTSATSEPSAPSATTSEPSSATADSSAPSSATTSEPSAPSSVTTSEPSSSSDTSAPSAPSSTTTAEPSSSSATSEPSSSSATSAPSVTGSGTTTNDTIVDAAIATPELSTLVTALQAGDLVSTLSGPGPFTVFAPSNAAFTALKPGVLDSLLKPENKDQLVKLLTFHVASGIRLAKDISDGLMITTLEGTELKATVSGGSVMINNASVTTADIQKSNGVVHIIDKVLIPDGLDLEALAATKPEGEPEGDNDGGGSSGGAIAGIVIAVLAVGAVASFFAMKTLRAKQAQKKTTEEYQELNAQISQNPHC